MARIQTLVPGPAEIRALPTEELLASCGDSRHTLGSNGRNRYGNAYTPEDGLLTLGSCTSSTVSADAFGAAHRLHGWLSALDPPLLARAIDDLYERVRTEIVANVAMSQASNVDVVVTPSGTDAELIPLLACLQLGRPVTSILVGASEAGSGTAFAAAGLHFDAVTPSGRPVDAGSAIDEEIASRVHTLRVGIRTDDGSPRDEAEIDAEVQHAARQGIAAGRNVLLHVIAHSKTGVHAPSLEAVHELAAAHPDRVSVVIDAAQGRFSRRGLSDSLSRGYMTMTTGSKFFGGPPFAGAVLIPRASTAAPIESFPAGFSDYLSPSMLPRTWRAARDSLADWYNVGVLLRWWAALAEIRDYYSVPAQLRLEVLRQFQSVVPATMASTSTLTLVTTPPPMVENDVARLLESKTTVFAFTCRTSDGTLLDVDELRALQRMMRDPIDPARTLDLPTELRDLRAELGQPVALGRTSSRSVLRLALGARQIIRACVVSSTGSTFGERLDALTDEVSATVRKLDQLVLDFESTPTAITS